MFMDNFKNRVDFLISTHYIIELNNTIMIIVLSIVHIISIVQIKEYLYAVLLNDTHVYLIITIKVSCVA